MTPLIHSENSNMTMIVVVVDVDVATSDYNTTFNASVLAFGLR